MLLAKSELGLICGQLTWQEALPGSASYKVSSSSCQIPKHSWGRGQSGSGALIWVSRSSRGRQLVPAFGAVPAGSGLLGQLCHIKQVPALEQQMKKPTRISSSEFVNEELCFRDCLVWINLCGLGSYKGFKHLFSPRLWGLIILSALPSRHFWLSIISACADCCGEQGWTCQSKQTFLLYWKSHNFNNSL